MNIKEANLKVKLKTFFFRFVEFLYPFHGLTDRQQKVLALLLYYHYELKQQITNDRILWKEVFDYDTKVKIYSELGIQSTALENLLSQLRKKKVIIDNQISGVYIPLIDSKSKVFSLKFNFNIIHESS